MASPPPPPPPQPTPQVSLPQQMPQASLQHQQGLNAPVSGAADPNTHNSTAGSLGGAPQPFTGQDTQSQGHLTGDTSHGGEPPSDMNGDALMSNSNVEPDISVEELDRLADEWEAQGKPKCPTCGFQHPPPCRPSVVQQNKELKELKKTDPEAYSVQSKVIGDCRRAEQEARKQRRAAKLATRANAGQPAPRTAGANSTSRANASRPPKAGRNQSRASQSRGKKLEFPWCRNCQAFHQWGQHTLNREGVQDLLNRQAYGERVPDATPIQEARAARRDVRVVNQNAPTLTPEQAQGNIDQRRAERLARSDRLISQLPAMAENMPPQYILNWWSGLYHDDMRPISMFPQGQLPLPAAYPQQQQPGPYPPQHPPQAAAYLGQYQPQAATYPEQPLPQAATHPAQLPPQQANTYAPPTSYADTASDVIQGTRFNVTPGSRPATSRRNPRTPGSALEERLRQPGGGRGQNNQRRRPTREEEERGRQPNPVARANNARAQRNTQGQPPNGDKAGNNDTARQGETSKEDETTSGGPSEKDQTADSRPKGKFKKGDTYSLISAAPISNAKSGGEHFLPPRPPPSGGEEDEIE
jgi:hypothetical protein